MTYEIKTINELEELINNRKYVADLLINTNIDINHLLCNLTNLTHLEFNSDKLIDLPLLPNLQKLYFGCNFYQHQTDFSKCTNLQQLCFFGQYNQLTDLSKCVNLKHLEFGYFYNQLTDLSQLVNLTHLEFGNDYHLMMDLSHLTNLIILHLCTIKTPT